MRNWPHIFVAVPILFMMGVPSASAQEQSQQGQQQSSQQQSSQQQQGQQPTQQNPDQSAPIPAYRSPLSGGEDANADPNALAPDTRALAGPQELSLGAPKTGRSYWDPYFGISATLNSQPQSQNGGTGWTNWTTVTGGLNLTRTSGNSGFVLSYLGAGSFSSDYGGTEYSQQLGLTGTFTFHRTVVTVLDQLAYLPEASFGYGGIGGQYLNTGGNVGLGNVGLGNVGLGNVGLQFGFAPDQSILTPIGQSVSNTFITELNTFLTKRSSITVVGSYGILNYFDNNLNNTYDALLQIGYNYQLTRKSTIALLYRFDAFRYNHIAQSINDNSVQFAYARRITGRLALQLAGGPDFTVSQAPLTSTTGLPLVPVSTTNTPTTKTTQYYWALSSSATYQLRRTSCQVGYNHGVSGGSGVLAGSVADNVGGSVTRQLTRTVILSGNFGYARNTGVGLDLAITPGFAVPTTGATFDYWFAGASFTRHLGRSASLYLGYQANYQTANTTFCIVTPCNTNYLQNEIFLSVSWRPRPIGF